MRSGRAISFNTLVILLAATFACQREVFYEPTADVGLYAAKRRHPWNRLHETLVVRQSTDGRRFGHHELDPLLWTDSDNLLAGTSKEHALRALDDFLLKNDDRLIGDPLRRAMLQHDLWGIFDWLSDPDGDGFPERGRPVRRRVAQVIRRLALSVDEIERLPDNYAAVVAADHNVNSPAPCNSDPPRLPSKLLESDGPWVQLAYQANGRFGTAHEENSATLGRSAFLMFLRVPENGIGAAELVDRFNAWAEDESGQDGETRRRAGYPSFQLPVGSQVALVRRMLLIDDRGIVRPTNITERVQLRLFDELVENDQPVKPQRFILFQLDRRLLLAGHTHRSLDFVAASEKGFELGPIRMPTAGDPFVLGTTSLPPTKLMETCSLCHKHHGLLGWARDGFSSLGPRPRNLRVRTKINGDASATAKWKDSRPEMSWLREIVNEIEPFRE